MKKITIDNVVLNVGKFDGNTKNHRTYERAKANIEAINEDAGMLNLEANLKKESGYNAFNLPREPQEYNIELGEVEFSVRSERTTKRPQYKTAAVQMENYINGARLLLSEDRIITGVAKENGKWCVNVNTILEQYELIVAGVKSVGIKQTIKYETFGDFAKEKAPKEIDLNVSSDGSFNADNFQNYVRKDNLRDIAAKYMKAYEKELKSAEKVSGITPINTRKGYEEKNTKAEGTNWAYVVKTLVSDDGETGELNILADPSISLSEKREELPFYELFVREPFGEKTLYIGIESIYNRIQDLKGQETITANTTKYISREIV